MNDNRKWFKTEFKGVRYRKHPTRKHGVQPDKYFALSYKLDGKTVTEAVGWASEGVKPSEAYKLLAELKQNQRTGTGPRTLAEMRADGEAERLEKKRKQRAEQSANVTFREFFEETFLPDAKSRWTPETTRKAVEHVHKWIDPVTGALPFRELGLKHINSTWHGPLRWYGAPQGIMALWMPTARPRADLSACPRWTMGGNGT